jgi:CubicO group peptidase (beta-lactamase class C family)
MQRQQLIGVAVAIIQDNTIVHVRGYGFADREACEPVTGDTLFRLASLSKPITAVAAMQLWEQHKLDLDADVRTLVPEWPEKEGRITPRLLMSHQSGIPHLIEPSRALWQEWRADPANDPATDVTRTLPAFADRPLVYPPGMRYHYSTPGYMLLSAVVQRAGGAPFDQQVQERIATPLGMTTLQPDRAWKPLPHRAAGYRKVRDAIVRVRGFDVSWRLGGGGYCASIGDVARLVQGLLDHRLLSETSLRTMWTSLKDGTGHDTGYGLGFHVTRDPQRRFLVWHEGQWAKARNRMNLYPDQGLGIVVLCNSEYAHPDEIISAIEKALDHDAGQ